MVLMMATGSPKVQIIQFLDLLVELRLLLEPFQVVRVGRCRDEGDERGRGRGDGEEAELQRGHAIVAAGKVLSALKMSH